MPYTTGARGSCWPSWTGDLLLPCWWFMYSHFLLFPVVGSNTLNLCLRLRSYDCSVLLSWRFFLETGVSFLARKRRANGTGLPGAASLPPFQLLVVFFLCMWAVRSQLDARIQMFFSSDAFLHFNSPCTSHTFAFILLGFRHTARKVQAIPCRT